MDDKEIVEMFFARDERAISEVQKRFGALCETIAANIVSDRLTAEECVNDALLKMWETIPPQRPAHLRAYFTKVVRNLAIDKLRNLSTLKHGNGENADSIDEIYDLQSEYSVEETALRHETLSAVNQFLAGLPKKKRLVLVMRFWHCCGVGEISQALNISESSVYNIIKRERKKLLDYLERKGVLN